MSDDDLLKRYLLGDLPGDEEEALERRLLAEDGLFELAEALEAEVLEEYARGGLTPAQNARLARFLRASPEGRVRLAVVRGLAQSPMSARNPAPVNVLPFARPVRTVPSRLQAAAAIAAMLLLALGAGWLASVQIPGPMIAKRAPTLAPSPAVFLATIALSSLRGEEEVTAVLVPAGTDRVDLRLPLRDDDGGYPSYRVVLTDSRGAEVASREPLQATRHGKGQPALVLSVDAARLPAGRYSLEIQGVLPTGEREDLAFPEFEVREP